MLRHTPPSWWLAGPALLVLLGCRGRPTHPVIPAVSSAPTAKAFLGKAPEPGVPHGLHARQTLFAGLADVESPLRFLKPRGTAAGEAPRLVVLPRMERAVLTRYGRGGPCGVVRNVAAFGFSAVFPTAPRATADLLMDPAIEKDAFWADRCDLVGYEFGSAATTRRLYAVEMLRRGQGPVRWDFTFTMRTERWDLPDGSVIMRHDAVSVPRPVHVTLYRGATWIEPHAHGSLVTEFLVMGSDLAVPFFLRGALRSANYKLFDHRATFLWEKAGGRRAPPHARVR